MTIAFAAANYPKIAAVLKAGKISDARQDVSGIADLAESSTGMGATVPVWINATVPAKDAGRHGIADF